MSDEKGPQPEHEEWYNSFGRKTGNQIAFNRQRCSMLTLNRTENTGEIYFTDIRMNGWHLIRGEYYPKGITMKYPTKWGKKKAIAHFIQFYLDNHEETIRKLQERVAEFRAFLDSEEYQGMMEGPIPIGVVDEKQVTVRGKKRFI